MSTSNSRNRTKTLLMGIISRKISGQDSEPIMSFKEHSVNAAIAFDVSADDVDSSFTTNIKEDILNAANQSDVDPVYLDDKTTFDELRYDDDMYTQAAALLTHTLQENNDGQGEVTRQEVKDSKTVGGCVTMVLGKAGIES